MTDTERLSPEEIRDLAMAEGLQLFIVVRPDACSVCKTYCGKTYWANEAPSLPISGCLKNDCLCEYRLFNRSGPSLAEMLAYGITAVKAGQTEEAQEWLVTLLQIDRYNEQGWLWLSATADNDRDRLDCIREVLAINPSNPVAQRGLAALQAKSAGPPPTLASPTSA